MDTKSDFWDMRPFRQKTKRQRLKRQAPVNLAESVRSTSSVSESQMFSLNSRFVLPFPNPSHSWPTLHSPWRTGLPLWERPMLYSLVCPWQLNHRSWTLAVANAITLPRRRLWQQGWVVHLTWVHLERLFGTGVFTLPNHPGEYPVPDIKYPVPDINIEYPVPDIEYPVPDINTVPDVEYPYQGCPYQVC